MRILADENIDYPAGKNLRGSGFDVLSIMDMHRGENDNFVLSVANKLECILLTNDKDFGDLVIRQKLSHKGVVLLRLSSQDITEITNIILRVLKLYGDQLGNKFTVVGDIRIR